MNQILIDSISNSSEASAKYALGLVTKNEPIPDQIINGIAVSYANSADFIIELVKKGITDIPDELFDSLCDSTVGGMYVEAVCNAYMNAGVEFPDKLVQAIRPYSSICVNYMRYQISKKRDMPDYIVSILMKEVSTTYEYAYVLLNNGDEVPEEMIHKIAEDPSYSVKLVQLMDELAKQE